VKDIQTIALTFPFIPNVSAGKELSSTPGTLNIQALFRSIAANMTMNKIYDVPSRGTQKAYGITVLIDSVGRLFSSLNE
jgi:hypothetical protein